MKTYTIYHIPGEKIGCSSEPDKRIRVQGFTNYEVLEVHTDIFIASEREIELQKEYGYKVDKSPYWKSVENREKAVDALRGRPISDAHKQSIAESNSRRMGESASESRLESLKATMQSEEVRNRISVNRKGKGTEPKSEETKRRISEAKKLYWQKKKGLQ